MRLNNILDAISAYAPNADLDLVMRAYVYSAKAHAGQLRKSGEPYLIHPIAVAGILTELRMDVDTISVALLHDTMEDCLATQDELREQFGSDVADMVEGVTKIGKLEFRNKQEAAAENFRKLVLAMAKDIRVILVKLADRLHNMRTMEHMNPDRQRAISQETLDIYAPIANRLGLSRWKSELEDHCFHYIHPEIYATLEAKVGAQSLDRQAYIDRTAQTLKAQLLERGLATDITGRPKHLASIYRKMRDHNLEYEQVHDALAFRVFVPDLGSCYVALGLVHSIYRHVPERLKDFIANPKSNGYQSLHTVVLGPEGRQIEVQIRTTAMHQVAENGIAAHWRYKEGHLALSREDLNKIARLRELFEAAQEVTDPQEFLETVKVDLFSNEIFVFTPKGDVKFFPQGASVLDFAYTIHSEVGDHCVGARVNGRQVPMRYVLKEGDTIEIITKPEQRPNRDWLDIARTGRALSRIRRYIREEEREKGRHLGREMLDNELKKRGHSFAKLHKAGTLLTAAKKFGHRSVEQLYLALATGTVPMEKALLEMIPAEDVNKAPPEDTNNPIVKFFKKITSRAESPVLINGTEDVMVTYGRCCSPLPGEAVAGYITRGRGITVHAAGCSQLLALEPERRIPVEWRKTASSAHAAELRVICRNKPGMLADVGAICKTLSINVSRMEAAPLEDDKGVLTLQVSVTNLDQLNKLMRNLEKISGVISVDRVRAHPPQS